jgi:hypothetical protein
MRCYRVCSTPEGASAFQEDRPGSTVIVAYNSWALISTMVEDKPEVDSNVYMNHLESKGQILNEMNATNSMLFEMAP